MHARPGKEIGNQLASWAENTPRLTTHWGRKQGVECTSKKVTNRTLGVVQFRTKGPGWSVNHKFYMQPAQRLITTKLRLTSWHPRRYAQSPVSQPHPLDCPISKC